MKRSVAGIAVQNGLFFIARRVSGGAQGGRWEFPGGKVEDGEGDREALAREFREEFAVAATVGEALASASFEHKGQEVGLFAYRISLGSTDFILSEHTEWRWASLADIESLDFVDSDRKLLPFLSALSGNPG